MRNFSYPDLSNAPTIGAITSSGGQTNILSPDGLGIDNPTISASSFSSNFGSGTEQSNFNFDETWVFDFGTPVVVDSIDFDSLDGGTALDTFTFSIAGSSFMFTNSNTDGSDISTDPFSGLVIAAGQDISVSFSAADNSAAARIASITVAAVPEPSSLLALLGVASAGSIIRRRRS
jgi:Fe-S cluster assembly iron-binding protein IscA